VSVLAIIAYIALFFAVGGLVGGLLILLDWWTRGSDERNS
jgi:hypothetical protein